MKNKYNFKFKILNLKGLIRDWLADLGNRWKEIDWEKVEVRIRKVIKREKRGLIKIESKSEKRIRKYLAKLKRRIDVLRERGIRKEDIERCINRIKKVGKDIVVLLVPREGNLSWKRVFRISFKNLLFGRSRVAVTVGGVAVGIGAIVLLVSFGYGLQEVVTTRIIWPDALKIAEVNSETTNVKINDEIIEKIEGLAGVERSAASVRLAGQVYFEGSKIDSVVVGARNEYLKLSNFKLSQGSNFSDQADLNYQGGDDIAKLLENDNSGVVAGVATAAAEIDEGDLAEDKSIWFRLRDGAYAVSYRSPRETGLVAGYIRGSILESYKGKVVWGGVYDDVSGQGRVINPEGNLMGKWVEAEMPLWEEYEGTYRPLTDENGAQKAEEVYLTMKDVQVLSEIERKIEVMLNDEGMILGETDEATAAAIATTEDNSTVQVGTEAATLVAELSKSVSTDEENNGDTTLQIWDQSSKEIMISQALVRAWNKEETDLLGKSVDLQYLITSTILPKVSGKALSDKVSYKIVGIVADSVRPIVYVPLGDVKSMGVKNYSDLRVLTSSEEALPEVRSLIQTMGLVTKSVADTLSQISRLFTIVRFLLGSFGAIALVVALFGMFNTMTVSLLERTREIGVMKSLGTTNVDVTRIFLVEAVLISASGGFLGVLLGRFLGRIVDMLFFKSMQRMGASIFILPLWFDFFIVFLAVIVGLVTGWYPSKRASRISALNALRYE